MTAELPAQGSAMVRAVVSQTSKSWRPEDERSAGPMQSAPATAGSCPEASLGTPSHRRLRPGSSARPSCSLIRIARPVDR